MVRPLLLFILSISLYLFTNAQPSYSVTHFTTENGLPANGIKGLKFDAASGFLWVATEAGLIRFDGKELVTPQVRNHEKINERMLFMVQNAHKKIFVADENNNIYKIHDQGLSLFDSTQIITPYLNSVFAIAVSESLYRKKIFSPSSTFFTLQLGYTEVMPLSDTSCLIKHRHSLFYYAASMKGPKVILAKKEPIKKIFVSDGHYFILVSLGEIMEWDNATGELKKVKETSEYKEADVLLWQNGMDLPVMLSGPNAYLLHFTDGKFYRETICTTVPTMYNYKFAEYNTALKTLFLGTEANGFFVIHEQPLTYAPKSPLDHSKILSFYTQLVMSNGTILTSDGQQFGKYAYNATPIINGPFDRRYYKDADSVLWYTTAIKKSDGSEIHKLFSYNYLTQKTTIYPKPVLYDDACIQKSGNNIYIISKNGLFLLDKDTLVSVENRFSGIQNFQPLDVKEIKPGVLAIACCKYLLTYSFASKRIDTLLHLPHACIRSLFVYKDYLFIGTYGDGIFLSKNGVTRPIPIDKNKSLLFAHCFMPDAEGFCWISSNKGLFKVSLADMLAAFTFSNKVLYYHYFGIPDGMRNSEMNGGCAPCAVTLPDSNTLSFPTMSGLLWVDPRKTHPPLIWKKMFIDEFRVNDIPVSPDTLDKYELPASTDRVSVKLATPLWDNPDNSYIQYQVDDSKEWNWMENDHTISLMSLSAGKHTLSILQLTGFGLDNYTTQKISFVIKTHWYMTWWFRLIVFLLLVSIVYAIVFLRTRQIKAAKRRLELLVAERTAELQVQNRKLEKRDAVQSRLISIINHDIITPLKFLYSAGNKLLEKKQAINDEIRDETIYEMTNTSRSLHLLAADILNWIKYYNEGRKLPKERFSILALTDVVFNIVQPIAHQKGIELKIEIPASLEVFQYMDPMKVLLYNLTMNAINFSDKGTVTISAFAQGNDIILRIADSGAGMSPEQAAALLTDNGFYQISIPNTKGKGHGLGYLIIRDVAKIMKATLTIYSEIGKGTTVDVLIKNEPTPPLQ